MRKLMWCVMAWLLVCVGVGSAEIVNHCENVSEFTLIGDDYGPMGCTEGEIGGAVDGGLYLQFWTDTYDGIAHWDKAGAGLNWKVTTDDTLSFYLHSYWNATYNPVHYDDEGYERSGYRVDLWYAGDEEPITIDGPRSFGNLDAWTFQSFNMPKDGTLVSVDWGVNMNRYKYFYLDEVVLTGEAAVIPGDANGDGAVDVGDLGILAGNYGIGSDATWAMGDFNNDGAVDVGDLGILAAHYGEGTAPPVSVPEPISMMLLGLGAGVWVRRR